MSKVFSVYIVTLRENSVAKRPEVAAKISMSKRGKGLGEDNGRAKLTLEKVGLIRVSDLAVNELARMFNVTPQAIWLIKKNRTWVI